MDIIKYTSVVLSIVMLVPALAHAGQETHYYNSRGQYHGRATTNSANPSQQSIYSNKGEYLGRAMTKPDGSVKYYDNHGRFMGSGLPSGPAQPKK